MLFPSFSSLKASVEQRKITQQCQICHLLHCAFYQESTRGSDHDDPVLIGIDGYIVFPQGSRDGSMVARWMSSDVKLDLYLVSLTGELFL